MPANDSSGTGVVHGYIASMVYRLTALKDVDCLSADVARYATFMVDAIAVVQHGWPRHTQLGCMYLAHRPHIQAAAAMHQAALKYSAAQLETAGISIGALACTHHL